MSPRPFALLLATLLAACASYEGRGLQPGISTEADVRNLMGAPSMEFPAADGTRRLAYSRGNNFAPTYMADIGSDGRLKGIASVLNDDVFRQINAGMTRDEVLRMIGPPGDIMEFSRTRQVGWDYRFMDLWGLPSIFSVTFDDKGVVVSKITRRIEPRSGP
jgi:outer membrane protein assembly factor BamE (lipoprotein component of BamABCDE complex)